MTDREDFSLAATDDLLALFVDISIEQNTALETFSTGRYSRLYRKMEKVVAELRSRDNDQRRLLMALYNHPNPTVRFKAAVATLSLAPAAARDVLQNIESRGEFPIAMNASQILRALSDGTFNPT